MEELPFPVQSQDTLLGLIRRGFDAVSRKTNQSASEVDSLRLKTPDEGQQSIEMRVKPFVNGKIKELEIDLSNYPRPSFETLNALFKTYGSMNYIDFEVKKSKEERDEERKRSGGKVLWMNDKKYGICINALRWPLRNGGYIPEFISQNDAHDFCEFLDILGVSFQRTGDSLKVKPRQWRNRATLEAQATAYERALEKEMDASLYSSTGFFSRNEKSVSVRGGGKYIYIKEANFSNGLTNEKILATQFFINEHFDLHFPNKSWSVCFYTLKDHTPQRDYHRARIVNAVS